MARESWAELGGDVLYMIGLINHSGEPSVKGTAGKKNVPFGSRDGRNSMLLQEEEEEERKELFGLARFEISELFH